VIDGWYVSMSYEPTSVGPLAVSFGPIRKAPGKAWVTHRYTITNQSDETVQLEDSRTSTFLGPHKNILAESGCGYWANGPNKPVHPNACETVMVPRTLKPGHSFTTSITLLTGLRGMGPLTSGTYVFNQPIGYTIPSKKMVAPSRAHVHITYQVADAYGVTGGASLSGTYTDPMGIPITFTYPSTWFARSVSASTDGLSEGAAISNVEEGVPSTDPGPMPDASPPLDFVRVTIFTAYGRTGPIVPDSALPLSMDNAKPLPGIANIRMIDAQVAGVPLVIEVSAGPSASQADLAAADAIVASIRPTDATNAPVTTVPSTTHALAGPANEVAAAGGYIWVAEDKSDTIQKVDPSTGDVVGSWTAPGAPAWLATGDGVIWVAVGRTGADDVVIGINTQTDETSSVIHGVTGPLVQTDEGLWGYEDRSPDPNWMVLVDPQTGDVIRHVEVGSQPFDVAASGRSIWMLDSHAGTVTLVDDNGGVRVVTDRSSGVWLAATSNGAYLGAWRGPSANDQNGPATSAFASLDGEVQPIGDIYDFRPMAVAGDRVWFVAGPHDGDVSGLCGMRTTDGVVDSCADISVGLEGVHDPVVFEPVTGTLWAIAYKAPKLYEVNAG
jgi:hypothetical protein